MALRKRRKKYSVIKSLNEVNTKVKRGIHIPIIVLIILIIAGLMIGFIWQKVKINQLVTEVENLKKQEQILKQQNEKAKAKVLNLLNDSRIIKIAQKEMKMVFPDYEVVTLPEDFKEQEKLIEKNIANKF